MLNIDVLELFQLLFFYIVLALIVSLDVFALTLSVSKNQLKDSQHRHSWGKLHASMHAGLLLFYLSMFSIVIDPTWLASFFELFDIPWLLAIADWIRIFSVHIPVLFGMGAIIWVWFSYRNKIIDEPESAKQSNLDKFQRKIFFPARWVTHKLRILNKVSNKIDVDNWILQAFLVAVDMLALAALVKSMPAVDHWFKIIILFIVIWVVVYGMARLSASLGRKWFDEGGVSDDSQAVIRVILRLLEPLLIFYFAVELMVFLILGYNVSSPTYFLAASFLLAGIISHHGIDKIVKIVKSANKVEV